MMEYIVSALEYVKLTTKINLAHRSILNFIKIPMGVKKSCRKKTFSRNSYEIIIHKKGKRKIVIFTA